MINTVEHIVDTRIYGIHKVKPDGKKRISIPTEWRELFKPNSLAHILHTWQYLFIIPAHLHQWSPDSIVHTHQIDDTWRILIGDKLLDAFDIQLSEQISLIGKWNHIELYYDETKANEAISRARQAAIEFQAKLISKLN